MGRNISLLALMIVISSAPVDEASAFVTEGHFWAGTGVANTNHAAPTVAGWWGPSLRTGVVIQLNDFWRLGADVGASHHFARIIDDEPAGPHTVISTALGVRYALDVFTYIPYVGIAGVFHPLGAPSSSSPQGEPFSLRATVGVDYRHTREISFGAAIDLYAPVTQPADFPHYSAVTISVGYHFRRF